MADAAKKTSKKNKPTGRTEVRPKRREPAPSPFPLQLPKTPPRPTRQRLPAGTTAGDDLRPDEKAAGDGRSAATTRLPASMPLQGSLDAVPGVEIPPTHGFEAGKTPGDDTHPSKPDAGIGTIAAGATEEAGVPETVASGDHPEVLDGTSASYETETACGAAATHEAAPIPTATAICATPTRTAMPIRETAMWPAGPRRPTRPHRSPRPRQSARPPTRETTTDRDVAATCEATPTPEVAAAHRPAQNRPAGGRRSRTPPPPIHGWPARGFGASAHDAAATTPASSRPVVKVSLEQAAAAANRVPSPTHPAPAPRAIPQPVTPTPSARPAPRPAPASRLRAPLSPASRATPTTPAGSSAEAPPVRPTRAVPFPVRTDPDEAPGRPGRKTKARSSAKRAAPLPALQLPEPSARLFPIEHLESPAHAARIQAVVSRIPGIVEAEASAGTGLLAVRPATSDESAIREAVATAGHRVAGGDDRAAIRRPLVAAGLAAGVGLAAMTARTVFGIPAAGVPLAALAIATAWPAIGPAARQALRGRLTPDLLPLASALTLLVAALAGASVHPEIAVAPLVVHALALAGAAALRARIRSAVDRLAAAVPTDAVPGSTARLELPAGAIVPADGRLLAAAPVDETPLGGAAGERLAGEVVSAGTLLPDGGIVEVIHPGERTAVRRAIAAARRAMATSVGGTSCGDAARFFPFAVLTAAMAGGWLAGPTTAAAVLGAATPLALAAAVPLAFAAGLGRAVSQGAVPRTIEALLRAGGLRSVVLDSSTAVARGAASVTDFVARPGHDELEVLRLAAAAEAGIEHPIARALTRHAADVGLAIPSALERDHSPGRGVRARVEGHDVAVGAAPYLAALEIDTGPLHSIAAELGGRGRTPVLVAVDGVAVAATGIADSPRESARRAMGRLELHGVDLYIAGGAAAPAIKWLTRALGLEATAGHGDLAPEDKRELVSRVREGGATALVAGAAADAPALAAADLGVSIDGSPQADAAAGVLLVRPDPSAVAALVETGWATRLAGNAAGTLALAGNVVGLALALTGGVGALGAALLALTTSAVALGVAAAPALLPID